MSMDDDSSDDETYSPESTISGSIESESFHTNGITTPQFSSPHIVHIKKCMQVLIDENTKLKLTMKSFSAALQEKMVALCEWRQITNQETIRNSKNILKAKKQITKLSKENDILSSRNIELELQISILQDKCSSRCKGDKSTSPKNNLDEGIKERYLSTLKALRSKLKAAEENFNCCNQEKLSVIAEKDKLEQQLKSVCSKLNNTSLQLDQHQRHLDEQSKKVRELQSQNMKLFTEQEVYTQQIKDLQSNNETFASKLHESDVLIDNLRESHDLMNDEKQMLLKQLDEKSTSLEYLNQDYSRTRKENEELKAQRAMGSSMEIQAIKAEKEMEIDSLLARLISSEESLQRRDNEREEEQNKYSRELRQKDTQLQRCEENVSFFKTQADVYKNDFLLEREEKNKLRDEKNSLHDELENFKRLLYEKEQTIARLGRDQHGHR